MSRIIDKGLMARQFLHAGRQEPNLVTNGALQAEVDAALAKLDTAIQSLVSNAADEQTQGQTAGSVASLTSLMAVVAPIIAAPLLGLVSHLPAGDWRMGLPFSFCASLQLVGTVTAVRHFRRAGVPPVPPVAPAAAA